MMSHEIDLQIACSDVLPVDDECLISWVKMTLEEHDSPAELTLRFVDVAEITDLNKTYRKQDKATNVLAFPSDIPDSIQLEYPFIGDVVVCPSVVQKEALEQNTSFEAHLAHIVIHGVLHLLDYDHIEEQDFIIMKAMEIKLLSRLGFASPYHSEVSNVE